MIAEAPLMLELEIRHASGPSQAWFGPERTVTIGRDGGCVIPLDDTAASRIHCIVTFRGGSWLLRDADSRNGTQVNQEEVRSRALADGDLIRIGRTEIAVRISRAIPPTPAPGDLRSVQSSTANHPRPTVISMPVILPAPPTTEAHPAPAPDQAFVPTNLPRTFLLSGPAEAPAPRPAAETAIFPSVGTPTPTPAPPPAARRSEPMIVSAPSALPLDEAGELALSRRVVPVCSDAEAAPGSKSATASARITGAAGPDAAIAPHPRPALLQLAMAPVNLLGTGPVAPGAAPAAPPQEPAVLPAAHRRRLWTASAWSLSIAVHIGLLALLSVVIISYEYIVKPSDFVVGLSQQEGAGRKALQSRRPETDLEAADVETNVETAALPSMESTLVRATSAAPQPLPLPGGTLPAAGFSSGRVGRAAPSTFATEFGEAGRRDAIERALDYLAQHQSSDGRWSAAEFSQLCHDTACSGPGKAIHDVGVTGLATLAFLGAGHHHGAGPRADGVRAALRWLVAQQSADGCLAPRKGKFLYSHAIATAALCQAYGLCRTPALKEPARLAVEFLVSAQALTGGWRYKVAEGESDTSVTGWSVLALQRATAVGFPIPRRVFAKVQEFLMSVTDKNGHVGYQSPLDLGSRPEEGIERFPPKEATTAIGVFCRLLIEPTASVPPNGASIALLLRETPTWGQDGDEADTIAWVFSATALARVTHNGCKGWEAELLKTLLPMQESDGCARGSWPAVGPWGASGGRLASTALMTLALEAPGGGLIAGLRAGDRGNSGPGRGR